VWDTVAKGAGEMKTEKGKIVVSHSTKPHFYRVYKTRPGSENELVWEGTSGVQALHIRKQLERTAPDCFFHISGPTARQRAHRKSDSFPDHSVSNRAPRVRDIAVDNRLVMRKRTPIVVTSKQPMVTRKTCKLPLFSWTCDESEGHKEVVPICPTHTSSKARFASFGSGMIVTCAPGNHLLKLCERGEFEAEREEAKVRLLAG